MSLSLSLARYLSISISSLALSITKSHSTSLFSSRSPSPALSSSLSLSIYEVVNLSFPFSPSGLQEVYLYIYQSLSISLLLHLSIHVSVPPEARPSGTAGYQYPVSVGRPVGRTADGQCADRSDYGPAMMDGWLERGRKWASQGVEIATLPLQSSNQMPSKELGAGSHPVERPLRYPV